MPDEIHNILIAFLTIVSSLSFCYSIKNLIPKGFIRFLFILPVIIFFFLLPLKFQTIHLQGSLGFFIGWLGSFKLLLFAFGKGPLSSSTSSTLSRFLVVGSLPIEIPPFSHKPNTTNFKQSHDKQNPSPSTTVAVSSADGHVLPLSFSAKFGFLIISMTAVYYKNYLHPNVALIFYCLLVYLLLETLLSVAAALAKAVLGAELEPQFNEPYLATSLQDFWGKRWNLMVTRILRPTVYEPVRGFSAAVVGRKWGSMAAVTATFIVSGLMHELIFYYMGRMKPTWEVTCFFLLHGLCLPAEIAVKRAVGSRCRPPQVVAGALTIGFVILTSIWLFFPQFLKFKADVRMFEEYAALSAFLKNITNELVTRLFSIPILSEVE